MKISLIKNQEHTFLEYNENVLHITELFAFNNGNDDSTVTINFNTNGTKCLLDEKIITNQSSAELCSDLNLYLEPNSSYSVFTNTDNIVFRCTHGST